MSFAAYLAGTAGLLAGLTFVVIPAVLISRRLLPGWSGPVVVLSVFLLTVAVALIAAILLGSFGLLHGWSLLLLTGFFAAASLYWHRSFGSEELAALGENELREPESPAATPGSRWRLLNLTALTVAAFALGAFSIGVRVKYGTGMTGFDSTWYHGPFAAGFAASGDTLSLNFLAPQFLSWFYPQNSELIHSLGILAYGNDLISPALNLGWFAGCLLAAWCIGRPYGGAAISLAAVAVVLVSPALADQAGEARNDLNGAFFLLAGIAVLVEALSRTRKISVGPALIVALAAGLAAGTKVNFLPAAIVLAAGLLFACPAKTRARHSGFIALGLLVGGAFWYLRNLIQSGNPLPWLNHLGPLGMPGPDQDVGGRDAASVWSYLSDVDVFTDWFFPGLHDAFGAGWPLLLAVSAAGVVFALMRRSGPARRIAAAVAIALVLAWLFSPTSASGPPGEPNGFISGLRYLAPALAVSMALLGAVAGPRGIGARWLAMGVVLLLFPFSLLAGQTWSVSQVAGAVLVALLVLLATLIWRFFARNAGRGRGKAVAFATAAVVAAILFGQALQSSYFENRYKDPEFTTPGLNRAFAWAQDVDSESIATNATRQYPFFGRLLGNQVDFIGLRRPAGGFVKPETCEQFRQAVAAGDYRYLVLTLDRQGTNLEFPREADWIDGDPSAKRIETLAPTVTYELGGKPDPDLCS